MADSVVTPEMFEKLSKQVASLGTTISKTAGAAQGAATGFLGAATQFATGKPAISDTLTAIGGFGKNLAPIVKHLEKQTGMYQQLTRSGVHFSGKMEVASELAVSAGLDMKQFGGVVEQNSEVFAAMGGTAQAGATAFFTQLEQLRTSELGGQMRALGISYEEQAENMAMIQNFENMSMRSTKMTEQERNAATLAFSSELDLLSKLTGKQSDELKKGMSEMQRAGDFKALQMDMSADMATALTTGAEEAKGAGIGDLFKDMMIRGFPSKDQSKLAALYGNSMAVMTKMKAAQDKGNVHEYNRLKGQLAAAAIQDQMANKDLAKLGGTTAVTQIAAQAMADSGAYHTTLRNMYAQRARELGVAILSAEEVEKLEAKARAQAVKSRDDQITEVPQQVIGVMIEAQNEMVNIAATTQKEATVRIYETVAEAMGGTLEKIKIWDPAAELDKGINDAADWFRNFFQLNASQGRQAIGEAEAVGRGDIAAQLQRNVDIQETARGSSDPADIAASQTAAAENEKLRRQLGAEKQKIAGQEPPGQNLPSISENIWGDLKVVLQALLELFKGNGAGSQYGSPGMSRAVSDLSSLAQSWGGGTFNLMHGEEAVLTKGQLAMIDSSFNELFDRTSSFSSIAQPKDPNADLKRLGIAPTMGAMPSTGTNSTDLQGAVNTMSAQDRQRYIMQNKDLAQLGGTTSTTSAAADALESSNSMSDLLRVMHEMKDALATGDNEGFKEMKNSLNEMTKLAQVQNRIAGKHLKVGKGMVGDIFAGGPRV